MPHGIAAMKNAEGSSRVVAGIGLRAGSRKYPDAREMIEAGLAVVVATDFNPGSSPTHSMPMVLSLAVDANENEPGGSDHRSDHQCRRQFESWLIRSDHWKQGKLANFAIYDCADYREIGVLVLRSLVE